MGNTGCNMCPNLGGTSYYPLESDDETIGGTEAWIQERLNKTTHKARLRIQEEVLDKLLAIRHLAEDNETLADEGNYIPPELNTFQANNAEDEKRTRRDIDCIPSTDEQAMSVVSESPFEDERLKRVMRVYSTDEIEQNTADLNHRSNSLMAGDSISQIMKEDLDENNRLGSESPILNRDTNLQIQREYHPELGNNVLDKWGFENSASDDSDMFEEPSLKQRDRLCLNMADMRSSRNIMLQAQHLIEPSTSASDQDEHQHEEDLLSASGVEEMFRRTDII